jgi:hypothetical protein
VIKCAQKSRPLLQIKEPLNLRQRFFQVSHTPNGDEDDKIDHKYASSTTSNINVPKKNVVKKEPSNKE